MPNINVPLEITYSSGQNIAASSTLLAAGTLSATTVNLRIPLTATFPVTAWVTGIVYSDEKSGAPIFVGGGAGQIWNIISSTTYPQILRFDGSSTAGSVNISLSAIGQECALGKQTLTYILTLSSQALSGDSAGGNVVVDVTNTTDITLATSVTAINTPFNNRTCAAEHRRLRQMEAC